MTSINLYDPAGGPALAELPPLPIGGLVVGTAELLQQEPTCPSRSTSPSREPER